MVEKWRHTSLPHPSETGHCQERNGLGNQRKRSFTNEDLGTYVIKYQNRTDRLADSPSEIVVRFQQRLRTGEEVRDEMEKFINNTLRENPEWIPVPIASRTPEGKVTIKDVLPLGDPSNPLRKEIALEIPERNRVCILLGTGTLDRIRRCAKPDCNKLFGHASAIPNITAKLADSPSKPRTPYGGTPAGLHAPTT